MMSVEEAIIVNAPIEEVYEQWTHIEDFPKFMPAVLEMRRVDETHFHWVVERGGRNYEATFQIVLRIPQRRIAWRTVSGSESSGVVCFDPEVGRKTRVTFKMVYAPDAGWDSPAALLRRLKLRLGKFKALMEAIHTNS
ncbi:MAG TPA: SRPBCC family protein [Verrucomicrobiae bacterium]|nr:SRPBCC family protein [Verrucomicrobiae bacterium]